MSHTEERLPAATRRPGRPVGSSSVVTRDRILCAARRVISQRGYAAATFQAIAVEADLSRPTMHYYFSSREEIYEVLVAEAAAIVSSCIAVSAGRDTLAESLTALVAALRDADDRDPSHIAFLVSARLEASRNPELPYVAAGELRTYLGSLVTDAVQRGELAPDTAVTPVADMLHSVLWGVALCAGSLDDRTDRGRVMTLLSEVIANGLPLVAPPDGP